MKEIKVLWTVALRKIQLFISGSALPFSLGLRPNKIDVSVFENELVFTFSVV